MDELTSRTERCSSVASPCSTIDARVPSPAGGRGRTRAARPARTRAPSRRRPLARCASTSSPRSVEVRSGVSPDRTSTSSDSPSSSSRALRTASPVPRGSFWTATGRSSNAETVAGAATTTSGSTPVSRAAVSTQSTIRRPRSGCRCFGRSERMRVPRPAAITTAPRVLSLFVTKAGAPGFEPGITGPKPVALPLGHAPECGRHLATPGRTTGSHQGRVTNVLPVRRDERMRRARASSALLEQGVHGRGRLPRHRRGTLRRRASSAASGDEARSLRGRRREISRTVDALAAPA